MASRLSLGPLALGAWLRGANEITRASGRDGGSLRADEARLAASTAGALRVSPADQRGAAGATGRETTCRPTGRAGPAPSAAGALCEDIVPWAATPCTLGNDGDDGNDGDRAASAPGAGRCDAAAGGRDPGTAGDATWFEGARPGGAPTERCASAPSMVSSAPSPGRAASTQGSPRRRRSRGERRGCRRCARSRAWGAPTAR